MAGRKSGRRFVTEEIVPKFLSTAYLTTNRDSITSYVMRFLQFALLHGNYVSPWMCLFCTLRTKVLQNAIKGDRNK